MRRLILDGVGLFPASQRAEFLSRYAPEVVPVEAGEHLLWIWDFILHTTQFFPHYRRDSAHRIAGGVTLPPHTATDRFAEVMEAWSTWHLAYRASFRHDLASRLPLVLTPATLLQIEGDPLSRYVAEAEALLPRARVCRTTRIDRAAAIRAVLS